MTRVFTSSLTDWGRWTVRPHTVKGKIWLREVVLCLLCAPTIDKCIDIHTLNRWTKSSIVLIKHFNSYLYLLKCAMSWWPKMKVIILLNIVSFIVSPLPHIYISGLCKNMFPWFITRCQRCKLFLKTSMLVHYQQNHWGCLNSLYVYL